MSHHSLAQTQNFLTTPLLCSPGQTSTSIKFNSPLIKVWQRSRTSWTVIQRIYDRDYQVAPLAQHGPGVHCIFQFTLRRPFSKPFPQIRKAFPPYHSLPMTSLLYSPINCKRKVSPAHPHPPPAPPFLSRSLRGRWQASVSRTQPQCLSITLLAEYQQSIPTIKMYASRTNKHNK